jgi:hypothetical protein
MPETNRIEYKQDIFGDSFTRMIFRFEDDIKRKPQPQPNT